MGQVYIYNTEYGDERSKGYLSIQEVTHTRLVDNQVIILFVAYHDNAKRTSAPSAIDRKNSFVYSVNSDTNPTLVTNLRNEDLPSQLARLYSLLPNVDNTNTDDPNYPSIKNLDYNPNNGYPSVTTAQRNARSWSDGDKIYNETTTTFQIYTASTDSWATYTP